MYIRSPPKWRRSMRAFIIPELRSREAEKTPARSTFIERRRVRDVYIAIHLCRRATSSHSLETRKRLRSNRRSIRRLASLKCLSKVFIPSRHPLRPSRQEDASERRFTGDGLDVKRPRERIAPSPGDSQFFRKQRQRVECRRKLCLAWEIGGFHASVDRF